MICQEEEEVKVKAKARMITTRILTFIKKIDGPSRVTL